MKKLILIIVSILLIATNTNAQSLDTNCTCGTGVLIEPFKVAYNDTTDAHWLTLEIIHDNFVSECKLLYKIVDSNCHELKIGNIWIDGEMYQNWAGDAEFAFMHTAEELKLKFLKE